MSFSRPNYVRSSLIIARMLMLQDQIIIEVLGYEYLILVPDECTSSYMFVAVGCISS
jgi:hypothetical protein